MNTNLKSENLNTDIRDIEVQEPIVVSGTQEEAQEYKIEQLYEGHVQTPKGLVYKVMPKDVAFVYLSFADKLITAPIVKLLPLVNNGDWKFYAKGNNSWKQQIELPKEVIEHKHNILKALIFGMLTLEANDRLEGTLDHNKYLQNVLKRSNKELERLANKDIKNVYGADPQMLTNVFNVIEEVVGRMVDKLPHEFFFLNMVMDDYEANPMQLQERPVELQKIDADLIEE